METVIEKPREAQILKPMIDIKDASVFFERRYAKNTIRNFFTQWKMNVKSDGFQALEKISVEVKKGEVLGIIGKNGAGKSTLLRLISGIYSPTEGTVKIRGSVAALLSLGAGFQAELSGIDNIYLNGLLLGMTKDSIDNFTKQIVEFSELGDFINEPVKTYSSGMGARLGFSIAVHLHSDIVLIDEVLGVGDKDFKVKSKAKIGELIKSGGTVLLVSHNMDEVQKFSHRVMWLEKGKIKMVGAPEEVIERYMKS